MAAYSGKLADNSFPDKLVPPVFNMRSEGSFYLEGEKKIEKIIDTNTQKHLINAEKLGRVKRLETGTDLYIDIIKKNFPKNFNLKKLKIVLDCANGAGYKAGPKLLRSLGAKVIAIGTEPNGLNINKNCGSTFPNKIQSAVKKYKAHIGIALDGDADRIIICDEKEK